MGQKRREVVMAKSDESPDRNGVQVIARAAAILRALEREPNGLSLGELAERSGLARSTVQRIVAALADQQLLTSGGRKAGVTLGPALMRLAEAALADTDKVVRPVIQALCRATGETVDLSVRQQRNAVFLDQAAGSHRLIAMSAIGEAFPLYCTANGKALLACLEPDGRRAVLPTPLIALTKATITDPAVIDRQLVEFGRTQVAYDLEEHAEGICAVGTAFIDGFGRAHAISIPVPAARFEASRGALASALLAARGEVLDLLAGSRAPTPE